MSPFTSDGPTAVVFGPKADDALAREMAATLASVVAVDAAAVLAFGYLLAPWVEPYLAGGSLLVGAVALAACTAGLLFVHLRYARRSVLAAVGAEPVDDATHPDLCARLTRLSAQFDLKPPAAALVDADAPNSLAVGGPRASTVVVSRGVLDALTGAELDAVLAHELAHVKNRDATVMTLASVLPAVANGEYGASDFGIPSLGGANSLLGCVAVVACYLVATPRLPGAPFSASSLGTFAVVAVATVLLGSVLLGLLAAPSVVLTRRLSRRRELVADRAGARATGDPAAMAGAIRTLTGAERTAGDLRTATSTLRGLCFLPHGFESTDARRGEPTAIAVRTHPAVEERLANLRAVAASLEGR